jgi:hypothetical protein
MKALIMSSVLALAAVSFGQACCKAKASAEDSFLLMAKEMELKAEGKQACCKSTAAKTVVKGEGECCNAPGSPVKFKVYVAGNGYKYFGCDGSAAKGRQELIAKGNKVGKVQPVSSARSISDANR